MISLVRKQHSSLVPAVTVASVNIQHGNQISNTDLLLDIQCSSLYILHISLSLITVSRVLSRLQPCSSNQCNTAHLESKLTCHSNHDDLIPWDWTLIFKRNPTPRIPTTTSRYKTTTPRYEECSRLLSGTLLYSHSPLISLTLSQLSKIIILVPLSCSSNTAHICHDKFLLPFVKLSSSPYCTNIRSQYNGTHYNINAQHGAWYNSTKCTILPLPGKSQHTHLSTVNVHNNRPIDSAHFAQPMSHNSTHTSRSLVNNWQYSYCILHR
jgi:hypothetical protein